jgi:hypothetical protein
LSVVRHIISIGRRIPDSSGFFFNKCTTAVCITPRITVLNNRIISKGRTFFLWKFLKNLRGQCQF